MKRILVAALAAFASLAFGATTVPLALINPAGSTSGQAIVSTGAGSAPVWSNVTASSLAPVAANTVIANFTASAGAPVAFTMPTCSTAGRALQYSGSGIVCTSNYALTTGTLAQFATTTSAQLAGIVSDETGSGSLVFGTSPTITTPNIVGVTNGANASAGSVGDIGVPNNLTGVPLTTAVTSNCASIPLSAGDWDVSGVIRFVPAASTTVASIQAGITSTSGVLAGIGTQSSIQGSLQTGTLQELPTPTVQKNVTTTTTVYLAGVSAFGVSTMTCSGVIRARRIH